MKWIRQVLIYFLFALQSANTSDFVISSDNIIPATFNQKASNIYLTPSGQLFFVWQDYRHGEPTYYAQYLNQDGAPLGDNFQIHSNERLAFLSDEDFISILYEPYVIDYGFGEEYNFTISAQCYNDKQPTNTPLNVYGNTWPWCGTGFLGFQEDLIVQDDNYLYFVQFNGVPAIRRISNEGSLLNTVDELNFTPITFSLHSWPDSGYTLFYFGLFYDEWTDGIEFGIYAADFDNDDQLQGEPVLLKAFAESEISDWFNYDWTRRIKCTSIADSVVEIFYLNTDSLQLNYFLYTRNGKVDTTRSLDLPQNIIIRNTNTMFDLTIRKKASFAVRLSTHLREPGQNQPDQNLNLLYYFDKNGFYTGDRSIDTSKQASEFSTMIKTGTKEFISTSTINGDIYSVWLNDFDVNKMQKLNDDAMGANQTNPLISKAGTQDFFISWQDESGFRGRLIDSEGNLIGNEQTLDGKRHLFFEDQSSLNIWRSRDEYYEYEHMGFTIYDNAWNVVKKDTLYSGSYDWSNRLAAHIINTDKFVILKNEDEFGNTELLLCRNTGELIKQVELPYKSNLYKQGFFIQDSSSFYVNRDRFVQLFSNGITPLTPEYVLPVYPDLYLGNNNFLSTSFSYEEYYVLGTIINITGDTLISDIQIAQGQSDIRLINLDKKHFMVIYPNGDDCYAQTFFVNGEKDGEPFIIHEHSSAKQKNPYALLNGDQVLFCWSDNRDETQGYNIMGHFRSLSTIAAIKNKATTVPQGLKLYQNYPNPFNTSTTIRYSIDGNLYSGDAMHGVSSPSIHPVELSVYNLLGQKITTLVSTHQKPGQYKVNWDAANIATGIYICRLETRNSILSRKLILLK